MAAPTYGELLRSATTSAVHLEMRDIYAVDSEQDRIAAWRAGHREPIAVLLAQTTEAALRRLGQRA